MRTPTPLPPQSLLLRLLRYEPETGRLYWRERTPDLFRPGRNGAEVECRRWNTRFAGEEALAIPSGGMGHLAGKIAGKTYKAHRVIWKMAHGQDPGPEVDHIDGDPTNNRLGNLASGTKRQNQRNAFLSRLNTSGATGVHRTAAGKWESRISLTLGTFANFEDAVAARRAAQASLGYSPRHGEPRLFALAKREAKEALMTIPGVTEKMASRVVQLIVSGGVRRCFLDFAAEPKVRKADPVERQAEQEGRRAETHHRAERETLL